MSSYRFQFRPVLTIVSVIAFAILVTLGSWQMRRLEWKQDLLAQVEARVDAAPIPFTEALRRAEAGENMEYTPVSVSGFWSTTEAASVFGTYEGAAGAYIFAPLYLTPDKDSAVYVNVGYVPQAMATWPASAPLYLELGGVEITGLFRSTEKPVPPASWFQPQGKSVDGLWFIRDPGAFAAEAGISAPAFYIDQFAVEGRDWPKGGTTRLDFNNRHLEYALTWFGLAATLLGVWLAFSLKKRD